jgi:isopentenyldiphosphate isomerase
MAEVFVEVNDKDKIIGAKGEEEFYNSDSIHRASALLILSDEGEVLLQRRKKSSTHYPLMLDFPAVAWVKKGESYDSAVERGMRDTLGLNVHCVEAVTFMSPNGEDHSFIKLYTTYTEGPFRMLSEDMENVEWMSIDWLKDSLSRRPDKFTPRFVEGINLYFEKFGQQEMSLSSIE